MEKIEKIYSEYEGFFNSETKNEEIKGLVILAKYSDDVEINVGHDELFAGFKNNSDYEKISEEDLREIFNNNWRWDTEYKCFAKFV